MLSPDDFPLGDDGVHAYVVVFAGDDRVYLPIVGEGDFHTADPGQKAIIVATAVTEPVPHPVKGQPRH